MWCCGRLDHFEDCLKWVMTMSWCTARLLNLYPSVIQTGLQHSLFLGLSLSFLLTDYCLLPGDTTGRQNRVSVGNGLWTPTFIQFSSSLVIIFYPQLHLNLWKVKTHHLPPLCYLQLWWMSILPHQKLSHHQPPSFHGSEALGCPQLRQRTNI